MQIGIHLPHAGGQATPEQIRRAAQRAEDMGLSDVWVSEHIIVPRATFPRSPLFYDPVLSLTWAAAATKRVRLGTSVLVLPMRHPLAARQGTGELAELLRGPADSRRRGRLARSRVRSARRAVPRARPAYGRRHRDDARGVEPGPGDVPQPLYPGRDRRDDDAALPVRPIPIWFGARSEAALQRTVKIGDGWHGSQQTPEQAAPIIARLRRDRPEPAFTISMRTHWNGKDEGELRARFAAYAEIGVQHIMVPPVDREIDDWDAVIEGTGRVASR